MEKCKYVRDPFSTKMVIDWIDVRDELPLSDEFCRNWGGGIIGDYLVLIVDEEDLNDDPAIVQISYLLDHALVGKWCWSDGSLYPDCHSLNIKYWARTPEYDSKSVLEEFKK